MLDGDFIDALNCYMTGSMVVTIYSVVVIYSLALLAGGCASRPPHKSTTTSIDKAKTVAAPVAVVGGDDASLIATFDGGKLLVREVVDALNQLPPENRVRMQDEGELEYFVKTLVRERLLAAAAKRQHLDQQSAQRFAIDRVLARAYRQANLKDTEEPTDAEAKQYYEEHIDDFTKPEAVLARVIVFDDLMKAKQILPQARTAAPWRFRALVKRHSVDRRTRRRGGSLGWIHQGMGLVDPAVIESALSMRKSGQVSSEVVLGQDGLFYIVRFEEHRDPEPWPFSEVSEAVRSRMVYERENQVLQELTETEEKQQHLEFRSHWRKALQWNCCEGIAQP